MENKYPLYIIITLALFGVLGFVLIWRNYPTLTTLQKEVIIRQAEFDAQEEYFQDLQKTSEELKKYEANLSKIDSILPPNPYIPELLDFIQKSSSQTGLSLKGIDLVSAGTTEKGKIKETRVNLELVGDYPQLKNFLSILEKSARLIEVESVSFEFLKEGSFVFKLKIKVYSY